MCPTFPLAKPQFGNIEGSKREMHFTHFTATLYTLPLYQKRSMCFIGKMCLAKPQFRNIEGCKREMQFSYFTATL